MILKLYSRIASLSIAIFTSAGILVPFQQTFSQTPDWSTSVATIIYNHCSPCHHAGAVAPFPLMSYDDAALWAYSIQTQINAGIMPPWPPDPNYSHFKDENVLTDDELNAINLWIDNGMPSGNLSLAPAPPVYSGLSLMTDPDQTIQLPVFNLPDVGNVYWRFAAQSGYTETKYVNSIEFLAGNASAIHHATLALDDSGLALEDDLDYPGPGNPRGFGSNPVVKSFMSQSEGRVVTLPANIGFEIPVGDDYVADIHYYTDTIGEVDSSKVNLKFCTVEDVRPVQTVKLLYGNLPSLVDGPLEIHANTVRTFHLESIIFDEDKSLLGLGPHAHQLCTSWQVYMIIPAGDTIPLIKIPEWDFDWQGSYLFTKVIKIPVGSQLFGIASYDNTVNNPNNPSNPPIDVYGNGSMLGEMALVNCWTMDYQPGDEEIILDSAFYGVSTNNFSIQQENFVNVFPNPVSQSMTIDYKGRNMDEVHFSIYNNFGEELFNIDKQFTGGKGSVKLDCTAFPVGLYLLSARSGGQVSNKKFVIVK